MADAKGYFHRFNNSGLVGLLDDASIVNQFDHPRLVIPIDLILHGVSFHDHGKVLFEKLGEPGVGDGSWTASGGIGSHTRTLISLWINSTTTRPPQ